MSPPGGHFSLSQWMKSCIMTDGLTFFGRNRYNPLEKQKY